MLIRKYSGKNLREALARVKADLGDEATVLDTRTVRDGLLSSRVEITAALSPLPMPPATMQPPPAPARPARPEGREAHAQGTPVTEVQQIARFLSPIRQEIRALRSEMQAMRTVQEAQPQGHGQVTELTNLLRRVHGETGGRSEPSQLAALRRRLEENGMTGGTVEELVRVLERELAVGTATSQAEVDHAARELLEGTIQTLPVLESSDGPRVAALVGPAGVGKTTLLAKIAARAALVHDRRVGIIGCDVDRIGAVQVLGLAADAIGIPWRCAGDAASLRRGLADLSDRDLILVDTSGQSPRHVDALMELGDLLDGAEVERHLVLNADLRSLELECTTQAFSLLQPSSISFTRLDQAVALGGLYEAMRESRLPAMYLSHGRRVPEEIEAATPGRLATLAMGLNLN
ncbi:MAG: hypothetical protein IT371_12630 [Deltaproteobacteria bacterium]|nr:hypothetical protein [Deltaproteobacteria bacterium]